IPQDLDSRAALYRDRLHGKNALVLLDNAATAEQVQPLLPAGATHLVLITSRRTLALDGTHTLPLDVLSPTDAKALLTHIVGPQRVNAEPTGTRDVIELCGRLPLAIALVAHRLQARPAWKFQDLAHRLHEASDRMSELAAGTRRVRAAFDLSYQALTTEAQTVFRLLGLHPGEDFTAASTAALAGHTPTHTRRVLDHLVDEHLVMVTNGDRYRLHDLLRDYARDLIKTEDTDHRTTALSRLLCWLSHSAVAARRWLLPEDPIGLPVWDAEPPYLPEFSDKDKALHWLDAESPTLANAVDAAIEHELPDAAWRLAIALQAHFRLTSDRSMWLEIGKKGLAAARAAGDSRGEGWALNDLGVAHAETGDLDTAAEFFAASVAIRTELGEQQTLCRAVGNLAFAHVLRDDYPKAISEFEKARRIAQEVGDVFFEAGLVNNLGEAYLRAGRYDEAIDQFRQGITMSDKEGQLRNRGLTRHGLGSALTQLDRHSEAVVPLREALELHRQAKSRADEGLVLRTLGIAFDGLGDTARAVQCWEQALELLDQLGHTFAADVRKLLADSVAST
ncbi:tetratricopeptide (TPR) repeat protein, partial [Prauserella marina]